MLGYFTINGVSSKDYNIYLTDADTYGIAERDVEVLSVAGRNGDLLFDNNRYKNKSFRYPCIIRGEFDKNFSAFMNVILSQKGYMRIEDSFHPNEYILARYTGETVPKKVVSEGEDGVFELTFDRKPQRFIKDGEKAIEMVSSGSVKNQYPTTALPLVRVYGTGYVQINGVKITINTASVYTDIDCDTQNAYKGSTNCNSNITLNDGKFFELVSGVNTITLNGVSKIELKPNWWIL